ncbi:hypothetical protein LGH83_07585 [Lichenihabitans sp. PAMC28606]|uniref:hypothetical protein n=1 Tax=Lichenihabitans sp. PAMC28606 TaxID=2880932 RepID=UPI001D0BB930|nr:hypothetical protein [Lichenihabitans sp. PAMC28606]UDL96047.1 hypothetical protein LGH83_07585 [Lichenihabitans sp. PAMC28606]
MSSRLPIEHSKSNRRWVARAATSLVAILLAMGGFGVARAQMVLPGAVAPAPEGTRETPKPTRAKSKAPPDERHAAPLQVIPATALAGKTLSLNGGKSQITFEARDKILSVPHLTLTGELISNPRETCQIETPSTAIPVTMPGRQDGIERVQITFPACPITFDVLDGAALVNKSQAVCVFKDANCQVNPVGLWGPQAGDLGPDRVKEIEHLRARAEAAVRENFKALAKSTKDRTAIMGFAREQAQFSSTREETCRDYVGEGRHGFCATTMTEARASVLRAKLGDSLEVKAERKRKRSGHAAKP